MTESQNGGTIAWYDYLLARRSLILQCLPQTYDARKEEQVECIMQALATDVGALYKTLAPKAYSNQVVGSSTKLILNSHRSIIRCNSSF